MMENIFQEDSLHDWLQSDTKACKNLLVKTEAKKALGTSALPVSHHH